MIQSAILGNDAIFEKEKKEKKETEKLLVELSKENFNQLRLRILFLLYKFKANELLPYFIYDKNKIIKNILFLADLSRYRTGIHHFEEYGYLYEKKIQDLNLPVESSINKARFSISFHRSMIEKFGSIQKWRIICSA